jgi:hypothetical protein
MSRQLTRTEIPIYSTIGKAMSDKQNIENLLLAYSNCPEDYRNKEDSLDKLNQAAGKR